MQLKVLVALDFSAPAFWAAHYAVKLAARLKSPLIFLGILPPEMADHDSGSSIIPADIPENYRQRLEEVVRLTQKEGVSLEIFLSSGTILCRNQPFFKWTGTFSVLYHWGAARKPVPRLWSL